MEKQDKITVEATGEFPFRFFIEKAIATEKGEDFIIEGIASTTNIDHDNERMSESALRAMEAAINEKGVPLRVEHAKEDEAIIGKVYEAVVDERNQLRIKARLDKSHPVSSILYSSMKQGAKMGLSVGGMVKHAVRELSEKTGKMVKTFYDVMLSEVSVTPRPANYDSWLVAKSITDREDEGDRFRESALYSEFLFENPKLDYLQAFAKSIPDGAWHKIASQDYKPMEKENKAEKTNEETATEKAVSRQEFESLKTLISKGFEAVGKALEVGAHDQNAPGKDKPKEIGDEVSAAKTAADGTDEDGTREKAEDDETKEKAEGDAMDQNNPDKAKPKEVGDTAKAAKDTTDEYSLETVERATKSIEALLSKMTEDETKEKSETEADETKKAEDDTETKEKSEDEDETTKGMHPVDALALAISKTLAAMVTKMEKSGKSIPGFEKSYINSLREDPEFQEEVKKMMTVPGVKKSVVMGTPFVKTKDGRQFALTMVEAGAPIAKSANQKDDFKSVFKANFSSVKQAE